MMKPTALFLFCSLILISGNRASEVKPVPTASPTEITKSTTTTTHAPETTTPSSTTTSSTTPSTTTSTEAPKTTTHSPAPITTKAPPTPVPEPSASTWNITDKNNTIIAHMAAQFSVTYNVPDEKIKNKTVLINIPQANKTTTGAIFDSELQAMKINWKSSGVGNNSLSLVFKNSNVTKTYWLSRLEVTIQADDLPGINSTMPVKLYHNQAHFNTTIGSSYRCIKLQNLNLTQQNDTQVMGLLKVTDLQFQAYKTGQDAHFGLAEDCAFDTPDIVPIAVGCVLAGLVVIILVGYLITRHRSQARGYLSM